MSLQLLKTSFIFIERRYISTSNRRDEEKDGRYLPKQNYNVLLRLFVFFFLTSVLEEALFSLTNNPLI